MHQPLGLYFPIIPKKCCYFFFLPKECRPQQTYQSSWRNQSRPVAFCAVGLFVNLLSVVPWQCPCMIARTLEVLAFGEVIVCTLKYVFSYQNCSFLLFYFCSNSVEALQFNNIHHSFPLCLTIYLLIYSSTYLFKSAYKQMPQCKMTTSEIKWKTINDTSELPLPPLSSAFSILLSKNISIYFCDGLDQYQSIHQRYLT